MDSSEKMNYILYEAAKKGTIIDFKNYRTPLDQLLTANKNTVLHVHLINRSRETESIDFVDRILEMCPPLLLQVNKKGETPLHLAARYGHYNVVKVLIDRAKARPTDPESEVTEAKGMLRMTNEEKDTALHEAARMGESDVVEILTKEDLEFSYSANVHGETPLYIAVSFGRKGRAERGNVIDEILRNCISVDYGGPNGRTALHAAIRNGDEVTARKMLEKEKKLTERTDQKGWSPLHYAAYFGYILVVKLLLQYDPSAADIADTEKKRTALHIAAIKGYGDVMKEIISRCPSCCEQVDNRGWNALHYVVASKRCKVIYECLKIPELARLRIEKDDKGNTPSHLIATLALNGYREFNTVKIHSETGICGLNKGKLSVEDIFEGNLDEIQKKEILESLEDVGSGLLGRGKIVLIEEEENASLTENELDDAWNKARESHLVVAALIATLTFAAAFTLPGGYKNEEGPNQGTAILSKKPAFIIFVISDAIAMVLSIAAVFINYYMTWIQGGYLKKKYESIITSKLFMLATSLTNIAMGAMIFAFMTGTHAVLLPSLGIATYLIGLSLMILLFLVSLYIYLKIKGNSGSLLLVSEF